jgi:hypothetical protein
MTEETSTAGTRRIVLLPSKDDGTYMPAYLEILQENGQWETKDHFSVEAETISEFGFDYLWSYFSSAESLADPIRHSREEVFREAGLQPWER